MNSERKLKLKRLSQDILKNDFPDQVTVNNNQNVYQYYINAFQGSPVMPVASRPPKPTPKKLKIKKVPIKVNIYKSPEVRKEPVEDLDGYNMESLKLLEQKIMKKREQLQNEAGHSPIRRSGSRRENLSEPGCSTLNDRKLIGAIKE